MSLPNRFKSIYESFAAASLDDEIGAGASSVPRFLVFDLLGVVVVVVVTAFC